MDMDPERVAALARNIAQTGLYNPITVRPTSTGYEVLAGYHRVSAANLLGWASIAANVQQADDLRAATIRLAENVQRTSLTPVEEATQLGPLVDQHPAGAEGVAHDLGRNLNWILDRLDLLSWPDALLRHVHTKQLSLAAAKRLVRIEPETLRAERIDQAAHYHIDAKTAALWLQDSQSTAPVDFQMPENANPHAENSYQTLTTVACFVCRERVDHQTTVPKHVCLNCLNQLSHAASNQPATPL